MVDMTSHVIPQKPLHCKLFTTVCALKVLLFSRMLSLAVVKKLDAISKQS